MGEGGNHHINDVMIADMIKNHIMFTIFSHKIGGGNCHGRYFDVVLEKTKNYVVLEIYLK